MIVQAGDRDCVASEVFPSLLATERPPQAAYRQESQRSRTRLHSSLLPHATYCAAPPLVTGQSRRYLAVNTRLPA